MKKSQFFRKVLFLMLLIEVIPLVSFSQYLSFQWAKKFGDWCREYCYDLKTDNSHNIYITGSYCSSSIQFDSFLLINPGNPAFDDAYIAKLDPSGSVIWARTFGWAFTDEAHAMEVDQQGNIYLAGNFEGDMIIDSDTITGISDYDIFILKFNSNGTLIWSKSIGASGFDYCNDLAIDGFGNLFITGVYEGTSILFDTISLSNIDFSEYVYVAKLDSSGKFLWALDSDNLDLSNNSGVSVCVDNSGNSYTAGYYHSPFLTFSNSTVFNSNISGYSRDIFICKHNTNGNLLWLKSFGDTLMDGISEIKIDQNENLIMSGGFSSPTINFGNFQLLNTDITGSSSDAFLAKLDSSGNTIWAKSISGTEIESCESIDIDANANIYASGRFDSDTVQFDNLQMIYVNTGSGVLDDNFFVAKYSTAGNAIWAEGFGSNDNESWSKIKIDGLNTGIISGSFTSSILTLGNTTLINNDLEDVFIAKFDITTGINGLLLNDQGTFSYFDGLNGIIKLSSPFNMQEVIVYNSIGQRVNLFHPNSIYFEFAPEKTGIYFVSILTWQGKSNHKVIVQL